MKKNLVNFTDGGFTDSFIKFHIKGNFLHCMVNWSLNETSKPEYYHLRNMLPVNRILSNLRKFFFNLSNK